MEAQADEEFWAYETSCVNSPAAIEDRTRIWHFDVANFTLLTGTPDRPRGALAVRQHINAPGEGERTVMAYQACGDEDQRSRAGMVEAGDS